MPAQDERGASSVEHGLLLTGVAAVIAGAVFLLGTVVHDTLFDPGCDELVGHIKSSSGSSGGGDCHQ